MILRLHFSSLITEIDNFKYSTYSSIHRYNIKFLLGNLSSSFCMKSYCLQVIPTAGVALTTEFDFLFGGCDDDEDDFPLIYSFFVQHGSKMRRLKLPQEDSETTSVLEEG